MKKSLPILALVVSLFLMVVPVSAISEEQKAIIKERCDIIKEDLKNVQHADLKTRVYLGRYYETILSKFITPLNVRLVENDLRDDNLFDNQNNFKNAQATFKSDYIEYQKVLEELVGMDCKAEPEKFYDNLVKARSKRKIVADDTAVLRRLASEQIKLATRLKERL